MCMHSWGKFWTKDTQRQQQPKKTQLLDCYALCTQQHQRGGQINKSPLQPDLWSLPSPHGRNQLTSPWGVGKGICFLFFLPHCCSRDPNQALPEFFVWSFLLIMRQKSWSVTTVSEEPRLISIPEIPGTPILELELRPIISFVYEATQENLNPCYSPRVVFFFFSGGDQS